MKACDLETYDLVIKNGCVLSFRPEPQFQRADIGIKNGKLHRICPTFSRNPPLAGKNTLDAAGCVVSPGFIDFHSHVDGNIYAAECLVRQGATTTIGGERNFDGSIINEIRDYGFLMNHGFYLSHAFTLRNAVGIFDPHRPANEKEIQIMLRLAEKFFQSGSFGIYFGLELAPGTSKREMEALSELAQHYGKKILVHLRKDGVEALDAVSEAIENAAASNGSIHILHLMYMAGHKELMAKCLELIKRAIEKGIDISADTGLYDAFPAYIGSPILDGNWETHYSKAVTAEDVLISSGLETGDFCSPSQFQYLREEFPDTLVTVFAFEEASVRLALPLPFVYVSTNACDGPIYKGVGHPETAGTFPKLIRKYVREEGLLSLGEALYKITYGPACRFGIENKGNLLEGYDADLVIFDYGEIADHARYVNLGLPDEPPAGIRYVIINGDLVLANGTFTEKRNSGRLLLQK